MSNVAILDVDGTLVDTNYHHALAWYRAFRDHGVVLPLWKIHRHIGMGGDQLVETLTDADVELRLGDPIRSRQGELFREMLGEVEVLDGAIDLIRELHELCDAVILSSSARQEEIEHYVDLLEARDIADGWTCSKDVEATKPAPDLVHSALKIAGARPEEATMIGDSTWDARAAARAGVPTVAVMTGGFSRDELWSAGAVEVYESIPDLIAQVRESGLYNG
jgi:HAD superfamily hydrolase (TIGR01509 family)